MSRLPTLSTPGRSTPSTGIPTPTASRRSRSSLGAGQLPTPTASDDLMDRALQEVLRSRPPSTLRNVREGTPESPSVSAMGQSTQAQAHAPRTPGIRSKTPSGLGLSTGPGAPVTPSASRAVSRTGRSSLSASTTAPFTPRRTSMASSTASTTPYGRRPESRASNAYGGGGNGHGQDPKWTPVVGEKVRINSMGYEGVLRFLGPTQFKEGVWAGVELEGGFAGKGKNDGSVDGTAYFSCPPACGIFVLATKLSPPTSGASRPASVASSHRSLASSSASYSLHGRATPSGRATPAYDRTLRESSTTPGRTPRTVSTSVRRPPVGGDDDEPMPTRTALGTSTSANAGISSKITAGSRASRYVGMTAKQLDHARNGSLTASVKGLGASTTTTPRPSRVSMGHVTPARGPRQSLGGPAITPRPRVPRASNMHDMMPPPPSPSNINKVMAARQSEALEEEIRELKRRNAELEEEIKHVVEAGSAAVDSRDAEHARSEVERAREELDTLQSQLSATQADANDASRLAEELQAAHEAAQAELASKEKALSDLQKEMTLASERAEGELSAGMEAKKAEVLKMAQRAEAAEIEASEMKALVDELTNAGQQMISLHETKQYELEERVRELEDRNRHLDDKLQRAREEQEKALRPPSPSTLKREAATAAEIDNETLTAQVKHQQNKIQHLEEELDDLRSQAENDADAWKAKVARAKDGEKAAHEQGTALKEEIKRLNEQAHGARTRVNELEGALKENQAALEGARAEIESLRSDAAEASSMRTALQAAAAQEKDLAAAKAELKDVKVKLAVAVDAESKLAASQSQLEAVRVKLEEAEQRVASSTQRAGEDEARLKTLSEQKAELEAKVQTLQGEIATLKSAAAATAQPREEPRRSRLSTGSSDDAEKKIRGFQHIIQDLSAENADLKETCDSLREEVGLLKEEVKLLEDASADGQAGAADSKELVEARIAIKELNQEVAELESLIEAKIYREDELETRATSLEREVERLRKSHANGGVGGAHTRTSSTATTMSSTVGTAAGDDRCELCEGPRDLDACPVFAGNMLGEDKKGGKWCADCESSAHDTADCPMAEDVF
ncbi:hypothetical protein IAU60_003690 [Kwoniella sp. DSM 27419]